MSEQIPEQETAPEEEAQQEPEAQAPPEPEFDPQAAYGHLVGQVDEIRNYLSQMGQGQGQQYEQQQYAPPQEEDFDPFDRNSLGQVIASEVQKAVEPLQASLKPFVEQMEDQRSKAWVDEAYTRIGVPEKLQDEVLVMSAGYRLAGQSPEQAMHSAYQAIRTLQAGAQGEGAQQQRDELETIVNTPGVAIGTQPGAVAGEGRVHSMEEAAKRIAAKHGIV